MSLQRILSVRRKHMLAGMLLTLGFAQTSLAQAPKSEESALDQELEELIQMLTGSYAGEAPAGLSPDGELQTLVHSFLPVAAPQLAGEVLYYQITRNRAKGPILQAKVLLFDTERGRSANTMRALVLTSAVAESLRDGDVQAWADLDPATPMSFPESCYFTWVRSSDGFIAEDADTCSYSSPAFGQVITPDMTYRVSQERFEMEETLLGEDGTAIVTTGGPLRSRRLSD